MLVNLHLSDTTCRYETRLFKQIESISRCCQEFEHIFVAGMVVGDLEVENPTHKVTIHRFPKGFSQWMPGPLVRLLGICRYSASVYVTYRHHSVKLINVHRWWLLPLAVVLKFAWGSRLLYDAHELETETIGLSGFRKLFSQLVERASIRFVDSLVVVGDAIASAYALMYPGIKPFVVMNCPPYRVISTLDERPTLLRAALGVQESTPLFLYQGGLVENRGIRELVSKLRAEHEIELALVFMGYGPLEGWLHEQREHDSRVHVHPAVPPSAVLDYTAAADAGIFLYDGSCLNHQYCLPNKLFEFMMCGLFIVASDLVEVRRVIGEYGYGTVISETSGSVFSDAMVSLRRYSSPPDLEAVQRKYSWMVQEQQYVAAVRYAMRIR